MKQSFLLISFVLFLTIVLKLASDTFISSQVGTWLTYENPYLGYSIRYPLHWQLDDHDPEVVVLSSRDLNGDLADHDMDHFERLIKIEILRVGRENLMQLAKMGAGSLTPWTSFTGQRGLRLASHVFAPSLTAFYPVGEYSYLVAAYFSSDLPRRSFEMIDLIQKSFSLSI